MRNRFLSTLSTVLSLGAIVGVVFCVVVLVEGPCVFEGHFTHMRVYAAQAQGPPPPPDTSKPSAPNPEQGQSKPGLPGGAPNGKKLVLKDGNFQLVREYTRNGERVRYYSLERGDWEEIPASMIDWAATQKAEAATIARNDAEVKKLKQQEEVSRMDMALDVDASLLTGSGAFLPSGEGMFAAEGKKITLLEQAELESHRDKKQTLKQILSPIPIVPGKTNVELQGGHAKFRIEPSHLEFYLREAPPDPDRVSQIRKSSRPGEGDSGPDVELVRATVKGNKRLLQQIKDLFGEKMDETRNTILLQRWEVAPNVYRFTLGEQLPPGEYALAEILPDGLNLYVWDFGVDAVKPNK
ncbi:MAG TPA: hypothetical protein VN025_08150 [Candidatus Dormibacteraeota bacterium]|nr:hypothetical protein [Candidatus Dormibacteraeota bacterium]